MILLAERVRVVFDVVEHMQRAMRRIVQQAQAGLVRLHQYNESAVGRDVGAAHFGPACYRTSEIVGEAAQVGLGRDRKRVGSGKSVEVRVELVARRIIKKKN